LIENILYGCLGVVFHEGVRIYRISIAGTSKPVRKELLPWYFISLAILLVVAGFIAVILGGDDIGRSILLGWLVPSGANAVLNEENKNNSKEISTKKINRKKSTEDKSVNQHSQILNLELSKDEIEMLKRYRLREFEDNTFQHNSSYLKKWAKNYFWY
jgi:hypothetical protein